MSRESENAILVKQYRIKPGGVDPFQGESLTDMEFIEYMRKRTGLTKREILIWFRSNYGEPEKQ